MTRREVDDRLSSKNDASMYKVTGTLLKINLDKSAQQQANAITGLPNLLNDSAVKIERLANKHNVVFNAGVEAVKNNTTDVYMVEEVFLYMNMYMAVCVAMQYEVIPKELYQGMACWHRKRVHSAFSSKFEPSSCLLQVR